MMEFDRRSFLKTASMLAAGSMGLPGREAFAEPGKPATPNDHIQIALIGAGGQGQFDTSVALEVPGAKLVAVADCYQGRLDHTRELWGRDVFTTRDYREVLAREDVDAVIIATPDHWHKQAAVDAMHAGKDVYLEKPMIHVYADGPEIIAAQKATGRVLQVGSQRVSSALYAKAKQLLDSGAIGQLNMVSAYWDRNSAIGAWEYTVPLDANTETCDWPRFEGTAPHVPFNAERFFQWRKWKAYGSGVAGDLFVHLFSGTNFITGANGPTRAMATGGLRYWKDDRDVPDVMLALFDYPEGFNLSLHVNFVDGGEESEGLTFTGSEGTIQILEHSVVVNRVPRAKAPGLSIGTFTSAMQKQITDAYDRKYPDTHPNTTTASIETYTVPHGYSDSYDHLHNFFSAVRTRHAVTEDAVFGFRAAGAALLANASYEQDRIVHWDPETMRMVNKSA